VLRPLAILLAAMQLSRPEIPKAEGLKYAEALNHLARESRIDPLLAVAIVHFESRWYPNRVSEDGEDYGLGQVRARYLAACRDEEDPVLAPGESCAAAKATLLDGLTNLRRMSSIIQANKAFCKEKIGSDGDPHWLAGYQGYNLPERQQWCKPGEKTQQVLEYHASLVERFFPKKKVVAKATPGKARGAGKGAPPAKEPAAKGAPGKAPAGKEPAGKGTPGKTTAPGKRAR
jgi:hypothetical protein